MRPATYKLALIMMVLAALSVFGCSSSSDLLDEVGQRYVTSLVIEDNDEETLDIDVIQDMCDNETESFTNVFGTLSLTVAENAPGVTLVSYSIEYTPLASADGSGGVVMPPELVSPGDGFATFSVASGGSGEFQFSCMSIDTKEEYVANRPAGLDVGRYRIRFIFHFEDIAGEDTDVIVDRTVYLANYDNC